jgi:hypothetical protein
MNASRAAPGSNMPSSRTQRARHVRRLLLRRAQIFRKTDVVSSEQPPPASRLPAILRLPITPTI